MCLAPYSTGAEGLWCFLRLGEKWWTEHWGTKQSEWFCVAVRLHLHPLSWEMPVAMLCLVPYFPPLFIKAPVLCWRLSSQPAEGSCCLPQCIIWGCPPVLMQTSTAVSILPSGAVKQCFSSPPIPWSQWAAEGPEEIRWDVFPGSGACGQESLHLPSTGLYSLIGKHFPVSTASPV